MLLAVLAMTAVAGSVVALPAAMADPPPLEVTEFSARALDAGDNDYTVAGGNPYQASTSFTLSRSGFPGVGTEVDYVRSLFTDLPPGFVGNAAAAARCRPEQLAVAPLPPECPPDSQVGVVDLETNRFTPPIALFNMVPDKGYPAQFAFAVEFAVANLFPVLRPRTGGYGVTVASPGIANTALNLTGAEGDGVRGALRSHQWWGAVAVCVKPVGLSGRFADREDLCGCVGASGADVAQWCVGFRISGSERSVVEVELGGGSAGDGV
jgi:hypothetical protein